MIALRLPPLKTGLIPLVSCLAVALMTLTGLLTPATKAAVEVGSPLPITTEVRIQPIRVKKTNGTTATFLGDASTEAYIKEQINLIWAQSGIVIEWLPVVDYVDNFAYDGSPNDYTNSNRPTSHLGTIVDDAPSPPQSSDATVVSMFFVEIVPGFDQVSEWTANGLAFIDSNGITVQVGENLLDFEGGRDVIAGVIAHEIGHNLGLSHTSSGGDNLMSPGGTAERLTAAQTNTVFTDNTRRFDGFDLLRELVEDSNYQLWAAAEGLLGGPEDDDDLDGIANVIEFMLGLSGLAGDPLPEMVWSASGLTWTLPKNSLALDDGLIYRVEVSSDGSSWFEAGSPQVPSTVVTDSPSQLVVRLNAGQDGGLMRLAIEVPPTLAGDSDSFIPRDALRFINAGLDRQISNCGHGSCGCRTIRPQ